MNVTEKRKRLKALNKEARTRADRLTKAGYSGEMTTPPIRDYSKTPRDELIRAIEDLQIYTRDPRSTVAGMKRIENETLASLKSHGYDFVNRDNLADFGQFMNKVREIHGSRAFPSNEVAQLYKGMERLGVSPRVIQTKFTEYLSNQAGITDLNMTLDQMRLPENRARVTSSEIMEKMKELGFI